MTACFRVLRRWTAEFVKRGQSLSAASSERTPSSLAWHCLEGNPSRTTVSRTRVPVSSRETSPASAPLPRTMPSCARRPASLSIGEPMSDAVSQLM